MYFRKTIEVDDKGGKAGFDPVTAADRAGERAIARHLAQTYPNIEIIVVNDGSTDATADVLDAYAHRVQAIHQQNAGLPKARNTGSLAAQGEFIALMDADDLCLPERIAVQVAVLCGRPEALLCSSDFSSFNRDGRVAHSYASTYYSAIGGAAHGLESLYPEHLELEIDAGLRPQSSEPARIDVYAGDIYRKLVHGNFVHPPTVMFRRRVLDAAGLFDETLRYTCDWEWMVRVARSGPFIHVNRPLLDYRLSEAQMSSWDNNGGKGAVDVVRAATKMWHADSALLAADRHGMRKDLGEFSLDAADALVDRDKTAAAKMLFRSVWTYGTLNLDSLRTAAKIILPVTLLRFIRHVRRIVSGRQP